MDEQDFDLSQQTQTQPNTQPLTQQSQSQQPSAFPPDLWGLLRSINGPLPEGEQNHAPGQTAAPGYIPRPSLLELKRTRQSYVIGRVPTAALRINSPKISSTHARIYYDQDEQTVKLEDSSSNGTWVNHNKARHSFSIRCNGCPLACEAA